MILLPIGITRSKSDKRDAIKMKRVRRGERIAESSHSCSLYNIRPSLAYSGQILINKVDTFIFRMAPRVVLMTGSSSGMGLAIAKRLALDSDQRFIVIATVISLTEKADLEAAVGSVLNKTVFIRELNILRDEEITRVVEDVIKTYGRVDVLRVMSVKIPEDVTREEVDHVLGVNLTGTIRLTQAVLPNMKHRMAGTIVTISSFIGKHGSAYTDIYAASKFGVEGYFESLSASLRAFQIRVCLFEPGIVDTPLLAIYANHIEEHCQSGSTGEIDLRQLSNQLKNIGAIPPQSPDDIAEALITRCLDVDEPVFQTSCVSGCH